MNKDGKLRSWGDAEFARKLVEFAEIEVDDGRQRPRRRDRQARRGCSGRRPYEYWGTEEPEDYSPDVTGEDHRAARPGRAQVAKAVLHLVVASPRRTARTSSTTLMGRPGPDPRPAPRYADESAELRAAAPAELQRGRLLRQAVGADRRRRADERGRRSPSSSSTTRAAPGRCSRSTITSPKLVKTLRETDQLRNTLIVFLSDNGWMQGEHRITGDKFLPYEESMRVPLIIRGPGVPKGQTVNGQVSNIDFAPTLLDAADASAGRTMDGVSLLPTARDPKRRPRAGARDRGAGAAVRGRRPGQRLGPPVQRGAHRPLHLRGLDRDRRGRAL